MRRYRLTLAARSDLLEIVRYIVKDSPSAAARFKEKIDAAMADLAEQSEIGHLREDLTDDTTLKFWPVGEYLIIYRRATEPLEIIRVVRGSRDVPALLD